MRQIPDSGIRKLGNVALSQPSWFDEPKEKIAALLAKPATLLLSSQQQIKQPGPIVVKSPRQLPEFTNPKLQNPPDVCP